MRWICDLFPFPFPFPFPAPDPAPDPKTLVVTRMINVGAEHLEFETATRD